MGIWIFSGIKHSCKKMCQPCATYISRASSLNCVTRQNCLIAVLYKKSGYPLNGFDYRLAK